MIGYIKLFRQIIEWEWFHDDAMFKLFVYLIMRANLKDKKWQGVIVKRGQLITSIRHLAQELNWTEGKLRGALKRLKLTHELTQETSNKYSIITVTNYELYQHSNTHPNKQLTNDEQTTNNQLTTTKESKESNNGKNKNTEVKASPHNKNKELVKEIIQYLNLKAEKKYKPSSKKANEFINARIRDGYDFEDFKMAIDSRVYFWKDDLKMNQYLRPSTVFNNKFEGYVESGRALKQHKEKNLKLLDNFKNQKIKENPFPELLGGANDTVESFED